jgi:hypothetical protein
MVAKVVLRRPSRAEGSTAHVVARRCREFTAHDFRDMGKMWRAALSDSIAQDLPAHDTPVPPDCLCAGIDMNLCYDTNLFYTAQSFPGDSHHYPPLKQQPLIRRCLYRVTLPCELLCSCRLGGGRCDEVSAEGDSPPKHR